MRGGLVVGVSLDERDLRFFVAALTLGAAFSVSVVNIAAEVVVSTTSRSDRLLSEDSLSEMTVFDVWSDFFASAELEYLMGDVFSRRVCGREILLRPPIVGVIVGAGVADMSGPEEWLLGVVWGDAVPD